MGVLQISCCGSIRLEGAILSGFRKAFGSANEVSFENRRSVLKAVREVSEMFVER